MDSAVEVVLVTCSALLLGFYIMVVASRSARVGAVGLLEAVLAWPYWRRARDTEQSSTGALVVKLMDRKRREMVSAASSVSQCALFATVLWGTVNTVSGNDRLRNSRQDGILLVAFGSQVFSAWNHKFGSVRVNIIFVYAVFMLAATGLVVATTDSRFTMMVINTYLALPRIIFSLAYAKSGTVGFFCALHTVAASLTYAYFPGTAEPEALTNLSPAVFSCADAACSAFVVLSTLAWEHTMTVHACQELEVTATRGETTAIRRLLNTICDATVELDAGLRIVDDALQLASTLQHGCDRSLRGAQAEQLLVAEDRSLFRERISAPVLASQSMANVLHVRMRDSLNNILKVELFHVPIAGSLTGASHLIGVREHADCGEYPLQQLPSLVEAPFQGAPPRGPELPATRYGTPAVAAHDSAGSTSEALPTRRTRNSSGCGSSLELQRSALDCSLLQQPLSVRFDATSFTVAESSGTYSEFFRPGTSFARFVPAQQEFFTDLSAGVLCLNRTLPCVPKATFSFQSTLAIDHDGAVLEGLCAVVLARGEAHETFTSRDASSQHPVEASLQVAKPMRNVRPRRAKTLPSGSVSSERSYTADSIASSQISNSSYLKLMMEGLPY